MVCNIAANIQVFLIKLLDAIIENKMWKFNLEIEKPVA